MRALLTDDSSTMRKIQKKALERIGFEEIYEAGNGKDAVKMVQENDFDIVFLDINMPGMSGIEALKEIRSNAKTADVPVVICSSMAERGLMMEAIKSGATNYIIKPFRQEEFENKVNLVLKK